MEVLDIHHSRERVEWTRVAIQKRFSAVNSKVAVDFLDRLRLENKSWGRIENYGSSVIRILTIRDDKKISNWTRKDIESIHIVIANTSWANSTKKDTLTALKRLYHFARHGEIADKARDKDYDPNIAWITPSHFRDRYEKIQSKDLLTDADLENLFKAVKKISKGRYVKRNVAALVTLFEGSYRPGELLNMRIGGLEFEDDFVRVHTTGKTGSKTLALVTSFVPIKDGLQSIRTGMTQRPFYGIMITSKE
jgi:site-specific recombinase XerD